MCGRYSQTSDVSALVAEFGLAPCGLEVEPSFNFAPGQVGPVAVATEEDIPELRLMRWGLVPAWAKEERIGYRMINARAETVRVKPAFRKLFKTRRCLVLADGFYEWSRTGKGGPKIPHRFTVRGGAPFAMAGLWDGWLGNGDKILETFTILTTAANDLVGRIHDRMPVILSAGDRSAWIDENSSPEQLQALLKPHDPREMESRQVSAGLNRPGSRDEASALPQRDTPGLFD